MGLLERLAAIRQALLTTHVELAHVRASLNDLTQEVRDLDAEVLELRDRVTRLEATRDADHSQMQAEIARFRAEVDSAESRLARVLAEYSTGKSLPPPSRPKRNLLRRK